MVDFTTYAAGPNQYVVDSEGNAYLLNDKGFKKPAVDKDGYLFYTFHHSKKNLFSRKAHRVVWEAFNGPIEGDLTVDHINGDRKDNRLENLQLLSAEDNVIKGKESPYSFLSPSGEVFQGINLAKFAREQGLFATGLCAVRSGKYKQHKGWTKYEA